MKAAHILPHSKLLPACFGGMGERILIQMQNRSFTENRAYLAVGTRMRHFQSLKGLDIYMDLGETVVGETSTNRNGAFSTAELSTKVAKVMPSHGYSSSGPGRLANLLHVPSLMSARDMPSESLAWWFTAGVHFTRVVPGRVHSAGSTEGTEQDVPGSRFLLSLWGSGCPSVLYG